MGGRGGDCGVPGGQAGGAARDADVLLVASGAASAIVAVGETVMRDPFDMDIGEVSDQASMAMRMVGAQRYHVGDRKHRLPKQ
eukprot:5457041-Prymnesium_polylepis.1